MYDSERPQLSGREPQRHRQAVLYTRVSSKDQARGGFSIPAQHKLLTDYAREHGFHIAAEFSDVETAGRAGRAEFSAMIRHVGEQPACTAILVEKTDRLYRNIKDWVTLSDLGLEVHLVREGVVLSDDAVSSVKFVHGIKVLMAKNYLDNLSEETRKGMLEKARQGLWPSRAPLGYINVARADGKRIIEPDPKSASMVTKLFEIYASGDYPLTRLTEEARRLGLAYRQSGKPLPRAQVHVMLRNPIYMGEFDWKGVRYRGSHEPLVSAALWHRVQDTLSGRAPRRRTRQRHTFPFSRLVQCGLCRDEGRSFFLIAERQKKKYVYYRCEECKRRRRAIFVREEHLVESYARALATLRLDREVRVVIATAVGGPDTVPANDSELALARLRSERADLEARIELAYDDRLAGRIDAATFDVRADRWRARIAELAREIEDHDCIADSTDGDAKLELGELADIFRETTEPLLRRRLVESLHSNSVWRDGSLHVEWRQPTDVVGESGAA